MPKDSPKDSPRRDRSIESLSTGLSSHQVHLRLLRQEWKHELATCLYELFLETNKMAIVHGTINGKADCYRVSSSNQLGSSTRYVCRIPVTLDNQGSQEGLVTVSRFYDRYITSADESIAPGTPVTLYGDTKVASSLSFDPPSSTSQWLWIVLILIAVGLLSLWRAQRAHGM